MRIGLLGGSFNPAHEGHLAISEDALKRFQLQEIWWIASPLNPLKNRNDIADYALRIHKARSIARQSRIRVTDIEQRLGTRYTIDTLEALIRRYPSHHFVWLMGADNLRDFHFWKQWDTIASLVPIVVYDRDHLLHRATRSKFAQTFKKYRVFHLSDRSIAPAWVYLPIRNHPISATFLRKKLGNTAFERV